jgi:hypothetical protein
MDVKRRMRGERDEEVRRKRGGREEEERRKRLVGTSRKGRVSTDTQL